MNIHFTLRQHFMRIAKNPAVNYNMIENSNEIAPQGELIRYNVPY